MTQKNGLNYFRQKILESKITLFPLDVINHYIIKAELMRDWT